MPVIEGARCLDLFAGSGANGIEALSRGAAHAVFVEREAALARLLSGNLVRLHVAEHATVAHDDALAWLRQPATPFDVVFLDPPFAQAETLAPDAAQRLETGGWLAPGACVYMELPAGMQPVLPANWKAHRQVRAGALDATLYRREAPGVLSAPQTPTL